MHCGYTARRDLGPNGGRMQAYDDGVKTDDLEWKIEQTHVRVHHDRSKSMALVVFKRVESARAKGDDRAEIAVHADRHVIVLADGAGGSGGGSEAADAVLASVRTLALKTSLECIDALESLDHALIEIGGTTAVLMVIADGRIFGASVGDSEAWLVDANRVLELTLAQCRKPLLGSGAANVVSIPEQAFFGRIVVASDGLFKYVSRSRILEIMRTDELECMATALVDAARLPNGALQDDIAVVVAEQFD
jgi:PPM family protein phosphatase